MELVATLDELPQLAEKVVKQHSSTSFIAFFGDLGAGKTTLIKNICNFLGVKDEVSSPTYSLVNEYLDSEGKLLYHFDFYRINDEDEALDMGCEEYFDSGKLCLVEWPENIADLLPEERLEVHIETLSNDKRKILLKPITNVR